MQLLNQIAFEELIRRVRLSADFYFTLAHLFNGSAVIDAKLGATEFMIKSLLRKPSTLIEPIALATRIKIYSLIY